MEEGEHPKSIQNTPLNILKISPNFPRLELTGL